MEKPNLFNFADDFIRFSLDHYCIASFDAYFLDISDNWVELLGYSKEELLSRPFTDFIHPDDLEKTTQEVERLLEHRTHNFLNRYIHKDGSIRFLNWRAIHQPEQNVIISIATDVTKREEQRHLMEVTQETARIGSWALDPKSGNTTWSNMVCDIHEVPRGSKFSAEEGINFYVPEHREIIQKHVNEGIENSEAWDVELQILTAKGHRRWVRALGYPVISKGKLVALHGVFQDIHEKKTRELEIERTSALLQATFDSYPSSLVFTNTDREVIRVSRAFEQEFGYDSSQIEGQKTALIYNNVEDFKVKTAERFQVGAEQDYSPFEIEYKRKDGTTFWGETISASVKSDDGQTVGFMASIRNLTEQREKERELEKERHRLIQASKMSTLGEMAGGIAHEINNPLAIIQGYAHKLEALSQMGSTVDSEETSRLGRSLLKAVGRMAKIISGLRIFARDGSREQSKHLNVGDVIEDTLTFCESRFRNHDVNFSTRGNLECEVYGQEIQLSQVLLNLLNNSFDAVREKGAIDKKIQIEVEDKKDFTVVHVKDWGPGIDEDLAEKVLEPFFTTKEIGAGTGLGLSISKSIIEDHNGSLSITNYENPTVMSLTLPARPGKSTNVS